MASRRLSDSEREAINKRVGGRVFMDGRQLSTEEIEKHTGRFALYKAAPASATHKSAEGAGDNMSGKAAIIDNTSVSELQKAYDTGLPIFMRDGIELDRDAVGLFLQSVAGKATDATRDPQNPASSFPMTASIVDRPATSAAPAPMKPYEYTEPDVWTRFGPNFVSRPIDTGIARPKNYEASTPGRNPADGPAPEQMNDAGNSVPVVKSAALHGRMRVSFTDIVKMEGTEGNRQ